MFVPVHLFRIIRVSDKKVKSNRSANHDNPITIYPIADQATITKGTKIMDTLIFVVLLLVPALVAGHRFADQATLKDCAINGHAKMMGGGEIICEVKKGTK